MSVPIDFLKHRAATVDTPHGPDIQPTHVLNTKALWVLHLAHAININSAFADYYESYFSPVPRGLSGKRLTFDELCKLEGLTHELSHAVRAGIDLKTAKTAGISSYFRDLRDGTYSNTSDVQEVETAAAQLIVMDTVYPNARARERVLYSCFKNQLGIPTREEVWAAVFAAMGSHSVQANAETLLAYFLSTGLLVPAAP